jgi:hypothetical protein
VRVTVVRLDAGVLSVRRIGDSGAKTVITRREGGCAGEAARSHTVAATNAIRRRLHTPDFASERRREAREKERKKEKHQTLSRVQHDVRRGCRLRTTMIGERNDGYTRAAPPTLDDVIPPAATWSPLTYARQRDTNITTRSQ